MGDIAILFEKEQDDHQQETPKKNLVDAGCAGTELLVKDYISKFLGRNE